MTFTERVTMYRSQLRNRTIRLFRDLATLARFIMLLLPWILFVAGLLAISAGLGRYFYHMIMSSNVLMSCAGWILAGVSGAGIGLLLIKQVAKG